MVSRLQAKASQIGKILTTLEKKYDTKLEDTESVSTPGCTVSGSNDLGSSSSLSRKPKTDASGPPYKKPHLKFEIPPFNPNKIRKSPLGDTTTMKTDNKEQQETINEDDESKT